MGAKLVPNLIPAVTHPRKGSRLAREFSYTTILNHDGDTVGTPRPLLAGVTVASQNP
jgi:hypothetical protein